MGKTYFIFGYDTVEDKTNLKYKPDIRDNENSGELIKIGREIHRYKQLDGSNVKEIERRFGRDANKYTEKKIDKNLVRRITEDIVRDIGRSK